jgi:hypothetical protein
MKKVTFYVATVGLQTGIDEVLTEEEYFSLSPEEFLPNRHWFSVTVRNETDKKKWLKTFSSTLEAKWTPNQTQADKEYNGKIIEENSKIFKQLEIKS